MAVSAGMSAALYGAAAAVALTLIGTRAAAPVAKKVQVAFRPPPPPVEVAPPPPSSPPPTVPKKMKVVQVESVPPPAPLVAPREVPLEKPSEAEPTGAPVAVASAGAGGSYGGASIGSGPSSRSQPIHLPESASPPEPVSTNSAPAYPEEARVTGREGLVILKIVIDQEGRVAQVELMRGEEPFASAAMRAVRAWRYRPAMLAGNPISIYRVVKVPFRLRG